MPFVNKAHQIAFQRAEVLAVLTPAAGYSAWYRANAIVGLSDGDPMAAWGDSSGNGYGATQASAGLRPTYRTGQVNGLPAVRFDGVNDLLTTPSFMAHTVFVVVKVTLNDGIVDGVFSRAGLDDSIRRDVSSSTRWRGLRGNSDDWATAGGFLGDFRVNGATGDTASDGVWHYLTATRPSAVTGGYEIGGCAQQSRYLACDVAEIVVYPATLSTSDRDATEAYLAAKYGL